jgi:acid stress-induced BolA-like protein IbaG/YrbA
VDLKEKIEAALKGAVAAARIRLEDDDGISGFVVSSDFRGMSALDRQTLIDKALRNSAVKLTKTELRRILATAALTPAEYETVDLKERPPSR